MSTSAEAIQSAVPSIGAKPAETGMARAPGIIALLLTAHLPLFVLFGGFALLSFLTLSLSPTPLLSTAAFWVPIALYVPGSAIVHLCRTVMSGDGAARLLLRRETWIGYARNTWTRERVGGALIMAVLLALLLGTFHAFKAVIPTLNPFRWDAAFADWDRALHFGIDPWRLTHAVAGSEPATRVLDTIYHSQWAGVVLLTLAWFCFARPDAFRLQYFLTFGLTVILLGSLGATWLSSAGPCFFEGQLGRADFAPLMERLHSMGGDQQLTSTRLQASLWFSYAGGVAGDVSGISAMPSMHVALVTLVALAAWRTRRWLGALALIFAFLILFGSVHLGWHYAIDGYVSVIAVVVLWWVSGIFSRWWFRRLGPSSVHETA